MSIILHLWDCVRGRLPDAMLCNFNASERLICVLFDSKKCVGWNIHLARKGEHERDGGVVYFHIN